MTNTKEKEVRERFDDFLYTKRHTVLLSDNANEILIQYLLSELSRVEKETENRVWREASEMTGSFKIATDGNEDIMTLSLYDMRNKVVAKISSTLLSQVK